MSAQMPRRGLADGTRRRRRLRRAARPRRAQLAGGRGCRGGGRQVHPRDGGGLHPARGGGGRVRDVARDPRRRCAAKARLAFGAVLTARLFVGAGDDEDLWRHEVEAAIRSWESTQLGDLKGKYGSAAVRMATGGGAEVDGASSDDSLDLN